MDADITLCSIPPGAHAPGSTREPLDYLQRIAREQDALGFESHLVFQQGDPGRQIQDLAAESGFDLLVGHPQPQQPRPRCLRQRRGSPAPEQPRARGPRSSGWSPKYPVAHDPADNPFLPGTEMSGGMRPYRESTGAVVDAEVQRIVQETHDGGDIPRVTGVRCASRLRSVPPLRIVYDADTHGDRRRNVGR